VVSAPAHILSDSPLLISLPGKKQVRNLLKTETALVRGAVLEKQAQT